MGYIYLVTNNMNGKQYIGQTKRQDINTRWKQHRRVIKSNLGSYLYAAYVKYGINNFTFKLICICFDEDCDTFEQEYIKRYNTLAPNGYNLLPGGSSRVIHASTIEKLREHGIKMMTPERREYLRTLFIGRTIDVEQRTKISNGVKTYWASLTKEQRSLIKKDQYRNRSVTDNQLVGLLERSNKNRKKVGCYLCSGVLIAEYSSITEASKISGISYKQISRTCMGRDGYDTAGGYIWKYLI